MLLLPALAYSQRFEYAAYGRAWMRHCARERRFEYLRETWPGVVLDPFMGSGTTALVARDLGRDYMGCDLNPDYVKICNERLRMPFEEHHIKRETRLDDLPLFAPMEGLTV